MSSKIERKYTEKTAMYHHRVPESRYLEIKDAANAFIDALIAGDSVDVPRSTGATDTWKQGFNEIYTFFHEVLENIEQIVPNEEGQDLWNDLLAKRDKTLISKLVKEAKL